MGTMELALFCCILAGRVGACPPVQPKNWMGISQTVKYAKEYTVRMQSTEQQDATTSHPSLLRRQTSLCNIHTLSYLSLPLMVWITSIKHDEPLSDCPHNLQYYLPNMRLLKRKSEDEFSLTKEPTNNISPYDMLSDKLGSRYRGGHLQKYDG